MHFFYATKRQTIRHVVQVDCEVVRERDFKLLARRTLDLSTSGMLVPTDTVVLTGEDVIVSFRAPKTWHWFDCPATVARVIHGRRPEDSGRCLGIAFDSLDLWSQIVLRDKLRGLPPPLPRRPVRRPA
jgi:hypothetical protein